MSLTASTGVNVVDEDVHDHLGQRCPVAVAALNRHRHNNSRVIQIKIAIMIKRTMIKTRLVSFSFTVFPVVMETPSLVGMLDRRANFRALKHSIPGILRGLQVAILVLT